MRYVFGPVPSRRLGRSLGVDLVPFKTCTYDCIYCQLGRTTSLTTKRREWAPLDDMLAQVKAMLPTKPDYITLSGSGEPTLHSHLDELIGGIRAMTSIPVAVLTNGSLLSDSRVAEQLMNADLVVPSLDAGDAESFQQINRPYDQIDFETMVNGLIAFRSRFRGECWLEIFLLEGRTSSDKAVDRIAALARRIHPDRIQLNTATRPTAETYARAVPPQRMRQLAQRFDPVTEVVADYGSKHAGPSSPGGREQIHDLLSRRPCTLDDIAQGLGMHPNEVIKHLGHLHDKGRVELEMRHGHLYYITRSARANESAAD